MTAEPATYAAPAAAATHALVRRYFDAIDRADIDGMLACVADDVLHDLNQGERRQGRDRLHAWCARMAHHYAETLDGVTIMVTPDGRRAAAEYNIRGRYLVSETGLPDAIGQAYGLPGGTFFAIRDGRIARITSYFNLTEWIMQVSPG